MEELRVISLEELKGQSNEIISLTPKVGTGKIGVRVQRLSLLGMCKSGKIPNNLLGAAKKLFYNDEVDSLDLKDYGEIMDIVSKEVLVEPTYEQFQEVAPLTDDQKFELFIYSQRGLDGLEKFHNLTSGINSNQSGEQVQNETKSDTGDKE